MCHRSIDIRRLLSLVAMAMFISALVGCGEYKSNNFASYSDVRESGLIERGWIPEFIPKSAYDIKEQHRVDVASIDVELMFEPGDIEAIERACTMQEKSIYFCGNSGYPVQVFISGGNHAVIKSVANGT
jgi:hypothetical protein